MNVKPWLMPVFRRMRALKRESLAKGRALDRQLRLREARALDLVLPSAMKLRHERSLGGVRCLVYPNSDPGDSGVMMHIHGGSFISGSPANAWLMLRPLHRDTGALGVSVDYALAPEHPYPAGLDDCVSVYKALATMISPGKIMVGGESAGGGLTLALLMRLRDEGFPLPACAWMASPVTDLLNTVPSRRENADTDVCLLPEEMPLMARCYTGMSDEHTLKHPYVSPLYGAFSGLPPLLFFAADDEILLDDAVLAAQKAHRAGVDVHMYTEEKSFHGYPLSGRWTPEGRVALSILTHFFRRHVVSGDADAL